MLKLSLPVEAGLFQPLVDHPKVLRVVALSGGFTRQEAAANWPEPGHDRQLQSRLVGGPASRPER